MIAHDQIQSALMWRYATKKFDDGQKLSEEEVDGLLEETRLSASSFGLQPWKFVVVRDPELRQRLREAAWKQSQVTDASHLIVLCRYATTCRPSPYGSDKIAKFERYSFH